MVFIFYFFLLFFYLFLNPPFLFLVVPKVNKISGSSIFFLSPIYPYYTSSIFPPSLGGLLLLVASWRPPSFSSSSSVFAPHFYYGEDTWKPTWGNTPTLNFDQRTTIFANSNFVFLFFTCLGSPVPEFSLLVRLPSKTLSVQSAATAAAAAL